MNITETFWRDLAFVLLAVLVIALVGGGVEVLADAILGTGG